MLGTGAKDANPGSRKVVREEMDMRSNVDGVPETPTNTSPEMGTDKSNVTTKNISDSGQVNM